MPQFCESSQYYHLVLAEMEPRPLPAFHEEIEQERVWGMQWGVPNDVGTIRKILVHRPGNELNVISQDKYDYKLEALIDRRNKWYYRSDKLPDIAAMQREHDGLVDVLKKEGVEITYADGSPFDPDAINVRDNGIVINGGIIITRMGVVGEDKGTGRRGEEAFITRKVAEIGMPILHTIQGDGLMEGGSFCLLDEKHAVIGMSCRGNASAVKQIRQVLELQGIELTEVPLTGFSLHIDGAIVMIDHDKALINVERVPYSLVEKVKALGIEPIFADYRDVRLAVNCLALKPGKIVIDELAPWTAEMLSSKGVDIITIKYKECRKKGGGIHCATLPLVRDMD